MKDKTSHSYDLEPTQAEWLEQMASAHSLPDTSKALRVVLDFAMQDGDEKTIFETIRCRHC